MPSHFRSVGETLLCCVSKLTVQHTRIFCVVGRRGQSSATSSTTKACEVAKHRDPEKETPPSRSPVGQTGRIDLTRARGLPRRATAMSSTRRKLTVCVVGAMCAAAPPAEGFTPPACLGECFDVLHAPTCCHPWRSQPAQRAACRSWSCFFFRGRRAVVLGPCHRGHVEKWLAHYNYDDTMILLLIIVGVVVVLLYYCCLSLEKQSSKCVMSSDTLVSYHRRCCPLYICRSFVLTFFPLLHNTRACVALLEQLECAERETRSTRRSVD